MSNVGIERLMSDVASVAAADTLARFETVSKEYGWTPIECLFFTAFMAHMIVTDFSDYPFRWGKPNGTLAEAAATIAQIEDTGIAIFPQCQLDKWRVDFLIGMNGAERVGKGVTKDGVGWLIVECDGHDFHERTKEQAAKDRARDREFQSAWFGVFRFTGSELYRDPYGKAGETLNWLFRKYWKL